MAAAAKPQLDVSRFDRRVGAQERFQVALAEHVGDIGDPGRENLGDFLAALVGETH